jgi:hypothetical protein
MDDTKRDKAQDMELVHTRTGLAQAIMDPLLRAFGFLVPSHPPSILIHYFMAELSIQSGHGLLHWYGLDRLRGLLSYRGGPSGDG